MTNLQNPMFTDESEPVRGLKGRFIPIAALRYRR
jgi:hypothetical protein